MCPEKTGPLQPSRMASVNFPALLAQVIPVVVIAVIVEAGSGHQARVAEPKPPSQKTWRTLAWLFHEIAALALLAMLEVAALLTANDKAAGPCVAWMAGPAGGITVGILLMVMARMYVGRVARTYLSSAWITQTESNALNMTAGGIAWAAVIVGGVCIGYFWPPSSSGC